MTSAARSARGRDAAVRRRLVALARRAPAIDAAMRSRAATLVAEHDTSRDPQAAYVVVLYDYARERTVIAPIRTHETQPRPVIESAVQFQLSDGELTVAAAIAQADPRVRAFLRRRPLRPLTRLYFPRRRDRHRYAIVFARPTASDRRYVIVDLSARRVTAVLTPAQLTGHGS